MIKYEPKPYTKADVDALKEWFDAQDLPKDLHIDNATYSPDLRGTVNMLLSQAYVCYNNPKMLGCILLLEKIKEKLEKKE